MRILITGAAGFVGAHVVARLARDGHELVATDRVPAAAAWRLRPLLERGAVRYVPGELLQTLPEVMPGVEAVWHMAANADIPLGVTDTALDLRESPMLTREVLEHMRAAGARELLFPSTSGVYGSTRGGVLEEASGPLLPNSLYAAGKLACEGLISAYCTMFGLRATIFRLGNAVGGAMGRGIVPDFVRKLRQDPGTLHILGDGGQRKSYVLVDDIVDGMARIGMDRPGPACDVYNLAAGGGADVAEVAAAVATAMGIPAPRLVTGGETWRGDQPVVELGISKALATGWSPRHTPQQAVCVAAMRLLSDAVAG